MLFRFKSKASGDVVMIEAQAHRLLLAMGREPSPRGIVTVAQLPGAIAALRAAVQSDETIRAESGARPEADAAADDDPAHPPGIGLRQRAWPMLDLLERSLSEGADVMWGV